MINYGKKRWISRRRNAGEHGKLNEAGSKDAASDGRASKKLVKVKLDEEVVDPDDVEMLEDLLVAAVNEALDKVDEASAASMSKFTGGMNGLL